MHWDSTVKCLAWPAVFPDQTDCAIPARKAHEWPVLILLLDFLFLLLLLLCVSEKQPGGPCLNLRAADHHTIILGDKANIKNARDAYVDCIRAEIVSIRSCPIIRIIGCGRAGGVVGCGVATALEAGGWDQRRLRDAAAVAPGGWRWQWRRC